MYKYQNVFKLHRWLIEVKSFEKDILHAVSEHVVNLKKDIDPIYGEQMQETSVFQLDIRPFEADEEVNQVKGYSYVEKILNCKMVRAYDFNKKKCLILYPQDSVYPSSVLYHRFFLEPISQLLRSEEASLVHGAILSREGEGVLLIGPKGAGKSSLSAALIELGFDYYGDEHPVLVLERGTVFGMSFPSAIALDEKSCEYFSVWKRFMTFHRSRGKYLLNPESLRTKIIGTKCKIKKIIFLRPIPKSEFSCEKIDPQQVFFNLLQDPFLVFHDEPIISNEAISHLELIARLSEQALALNLVYGDKDFRTIALEIQRVLKVSSGEVKVSVSEITSPTT